MVSVRAMRIADLDRVIAIAAELPAAPRWPRSVYEEMLDSRLALVCEVGRVVAGFVILRVLAPEAELESIAVASGAQRRGVGGVLMEAAIRELRGSGAGAIFLEVRASNEAAAGLYRRFGFHESGRRRSYYSAPVEDAVMMQLAIE